MEISTEFYILYGFLGFISLLLVALIVAAIRSSFVTGRLSGQIAALTERMGRLEDKVDDLAKTFSTHEENNQREFAAVRQEISAQAESTQRQFGETAESTQRQFASLNERIVEVRTLIFGINERISMLMRHRHDGVGRVYIVPEEAPAD